MKNTILLLLVMVGFSAVAQETLENRLAKVPEPSNPESVVKWAIFTNDMELLKYGVEKAGSAIKKMAYSHNQTDLNKGSMFLGMTPLMQAAANGNLEMVNFLLEQKVNVDATCKAPVYTYDGTMYPNFAASAKGITAIHLAVQKGHKEVVSALIEAGADIMTSYLELDSKPGAPVAVKSGLSSTPKQWAKQYGQTEIEEMLKDSKKGAMKAMFANPGKKKN